MKWVWLVLCAVLVLGGCSQQDTVEVYSLDFASGSCEVSADCQYFPSKYCAEPSGSCTNDEPSELGKYDQVYMQCVDLSHPLENNYSCTCVKEINKCGWVKEIVPGEQPLSLLDKNNALESEISDKLKLMNKELKQAKINLEKCELNYERAIDGWEACLVSLTEYEPPIVDPEPSGERK